MEVLIGAIMGIIIAAVISGLIIWLVGKLNLGLKVDNFGWAMVSGLLIGILTNIVMSFMADSGSLLGALVHLVIAACAIFISGKILKGLTVDGFTGALLAALAIAVVNWIMILLAVGLAQT